MSRYAEGTDVSSERSQAEIARTIQRYGGDGYLCGWDGGRAIVTFRMQARTIRFNIQMPDRNSAEFTTYERYGKPAKRLPEQAFKVWEQACRQRWRALLLIIKATLEAVEMGLMTFDEAFMGSLVLPNGRTIGESVCPELDRVFKGGHLPKLLPGG